MTRYKTLIFSLVIFTLESCISKKDTKSDVTDAETIYLNEGQKKSLKEFPITIKFKGISEDSRCPEGVNCIWAGVAVAEIEIMEKSTKPVQLNLATMDMQERGYQKSAYFNGYAISLQNVLPYPNAKQGTQGLKGRYKIAIGVKKTSK
ncbi:hypothetical protein [Sphingobacterium sp.]|uniref:hypothetical protein n=1 Tax=Sphingobacterium sp. TaxID=341027 RepID=UPI002FDE2927